MSKEINKNEYLSVEFKNIIKERFNKCSNYFCCPSILQSKNNKNKICQKEVYFTAKQNFIQNKMAF